MKEAPRHARRAVIIGLTERRSSLTTISRFRGGGESEIRQRFDYSGKGDADQDFPVKSRIDRPIYQAGR